MVKFAAPEWMDRFNNRRFLEPIGNIQPMELEEMYFNSLENLDTVFGLKRTRL